MHLFIIIEIYRHSLPPNPTHTNTHSHIWCRLYNSWHLTHLAAHHAKTEALAELARSENVTRFAAMARTMKPTHSTASRVTVAFHLVVCTNKRLFSYTHTHTNTCINRRFITIGSRAPTTHCAKYKCFAIFAKPAHVSPNERSRNCSITRWALRALLVGN